MLNDDFCWKAVQERDASQDGRLYFGVLTTGIYCRPSCAARLPLRGNVRFFESPQDAERAGLRPCKRCRPLETRDAAAQRIEEICRYIETHGEDPLTLETLARRAGMSRFHFQRTFKSVVGVTPKQYHDAQRVRALKEHLKSGPDVTAAVYDAGYGSPSRVYECAGTRLGMTPKEYRAAGKGVRITYVSFETPLGLLMAAATDRGLCFVQFGESHEQLEAMLRSEYPNAVHEPMREPHDSQFEGWVQALRAHLSGSKPHLDLPADIRATAFQLRVWNYLQRIPYGEVRSYAQVAQGIGRPKAARAVAHACASNVLALVIPCHRVIRGNGGLGGYKWGLPRKRALIDRERSGKSCLK
ncbi:MAG TPA: bifunctional DNA-binding transcriptional regulator/O6-methylguanine-DNA methyltransferase Ada [Candidatus Baltobacteraceae bacterium]|nr:bifunctional DNA-binding transcriptional regulator/O6-methylguanine-DNA methyltransferase Ada [Candidatus Baltobacteraceae bacterium]